MVHLRVADRLLDRLEGIREKEFIMGNIAPDSGVPNADWTAYAPPTEVSHFKTYLGDSRIYENAVGFVNRYMDIFAEDAFENRREYIIGFYRGDRENIEREYIYLTEAQAQQFVEDCVEAVQGKLEEMGCAKIRF